MWFYLMLLSSQWGSSPAKSSSGVRLKQGSKVRDFMAELLLQLALIYGKLGLGIGGGWLLGKYLPASLGRNLGKGLFWFGIPLSVFGFVRQVDLTGTLWFAPVVAWLAMGLCFGVAWLWLRYRTPDLSLPSQGSFLLVSSIGNTGYLGYPISLAIAGPETFAWALFYDLLGSLLWGYGVGVMVATYYGQGENQTWGTRLKNMGTQVGINPSLWSLVLGLACKPLVFPEPLEWSLEIASWVVIGLAIILIGMRLGELEPGQEIPPVRSSLLIKMAIAPFLFGLILPFFNLPNVICLVLVLQIAMPPAFATLIVSETYALDRQLAVSSLATGTLLLLGTLPIWLLWFR
ncbi:AEC family transporter [Picosynechococcus sp. PCC 11901]|nr:AEC family transporter [Picosynechococcus sp. PCC 11901]